MDACCVSRPGSLPHGTRFSSKTAMILCREPHLASCRFEGSSGLLQQAISHVVVKLAAPRGLRRLGSQFACHSEAEKTVLTQGVSAATPTSGSDLRMRAKDSSASLWLSEMASAEAEMRLESLKMINVVATSPVAEKLLDNSYLTENTLTSYDFDFPNALHLISELYAEVGEDSRQVAEYLQHVEEEGKEFKKTSDYNRRANLYGRVAEIVQARQKKGEKLYKSLEQLHEVVMEEDRGTSPADYRRRAELYSKSAEVFGLDKK